MTGALPEEKESSDDMSAQPGEIGADTKRQKTAASTSQAQDDMTQKNTLAPHAIIVETSLRTALSEVKGLKSQVNKVTQINKNFIDHARIFKKGINDDLTLAQTHRGHLVNSVQKFLKLAQDDDFKSLSPAMMDMERLNKSWQTKSEGKAYWDNKDQVMSDLNNLEKQLTAALDKSRSFNKDLNLMIDVG